MIKRDGLHCFGKSVDGTSVCHFCGGSFTTFFIDFVPPEPGECSGFMRPLVPDPAEPGVLLDCHDDLYRWRLGHSGGNLPRNGNDH